MTREQLSRNRTISKYLNKKDMDILYLIFLSGKKQKSVQKIMDRSQPSLCYDIKRIRERIEFIMYLQQVNDIFINFLEEKSSEYEPEEIDLLVMMFNTTSYTHTANVLGAKQISVRYLFEKILKKMIEKKHWDIYEIFNAIRHNKNKVKRFYPQ